MNRPRNVVVFVVTFVTLMLWTATSTRLPNGPSDMLGFALLAGIIAIAGTWVLFAFAGAHFTWQKAFITTISATAILAPLLAFYFTASNDETLSTRILFFIAIVWVASLGGTLWKLGESAGDAFREWRTSRA